MPVIQWANIVVLAGALIYMLALYRRDIARNADSILRLDKHASTASTFWLFFLGLSCVLCIYLLNLFRLNNHEAAHIVQTVLGNVASIAVLVAGAAYLRGRDFKIAHGLVFLSLSALLISAWVFLFEALNYRTVLFLSTLIVGPDLAITSVGLLLLGWAFYVRWSGISVAYLCLTFVYALLQFPAYLTIELQHFIDQNVFDQTTLFSLKASDLIFSLLAVGKILLIYGFISLLFRSTKENIKNIDEPQFWPEANRPRAQIILPNVGGRWVVPAIVHLTIAIIWAAIGHEIWLQILCIMGRSCPQG